MAAMSERPPLRVMLVDDHEVVRDGIKALLAASDDIVVCAEAGIVRDAVAEAERALPDVIVMDVRLSDGSGIEATRDIRARRPATQVLMLTSFADDEALFASIMAGAARLRERQTDRDGRREEGRQPCTANRRRSCSSSRTSGHGGGWPTGSWRSG